MDELAILRALDGERGLLGRRGAEHELIDHAAAFTRAAAWALHDRGWANIRKTTGVHRDGLDVYRIINRHTLQVVEIIDGAGAVGQTVTLRAAGIGLLSQVVEPQPPAAVPAKEPPAGIDVVELLEACRDLLDAIDDKLQQVVEHEHATRGELSDIRSALERAAARSGA